MIDRRASLFIFLLFFATAPALAQSNGVSREELQTTLQTLNESVDSLNTRLDSLSTRQATAGTPSGDERTDLASVLFVFLAIAVVFEAAMSAIFDWRIFIRYFEGKGVKTLVLVGTALVVTFTYDLDVLHQILDALGQSSSENEVGMLITALLISGGSSAVFQVYSNLGIRNPVERERKAKAEREKMAEEEGSEPDTESAQS